MRRKPLSQASDPAAIIAQALKKKFANHRGMSPDSDHENDSSSFFSDSNSPVCMHYLCYYLYYNNEQLHVFMT